MSKSWITFIFALWTAVLLLSAPILLRPSRQTVVTSSTTDFRPWHTPITTQIIEEKPILDWTGKLAHREVNISWDDKKLTLPYLSRPYSIARRDDVLAIIAPDGTELLVNQ